MTVLLHGWGNTAPSAAHVVRPRDAEEVAASLADAGPRGALPRGLGRSYGDAAQDAGGLVLDCTGLTGAVRFDPLRGEVTAPAGTSLGELIAHLLPHGAFLPVTPGTRHVTLGGAIAADVHGKNHHVDSSLGAHVRSLTLITPDGSTHRLDPEHEDPELFWATVGGMGLTGVIIDATLTTIPVESAHVRVDTDRTTDLDTTLELLAPGSEDRYSVAWVDLLHRGRAVVTRGEHARVRDLPVARRGDPLRGAGPGTTLTVPLTAPRGLFNRWTMTAFNHAYYHRAPKRRRDETQPLSTFFHPLDAVGNWNRAYGPAGAVQYQCVLPPGEEETLHRIAADLSGVPTFLGVLKRMGRSTPAPLSFPRPGWTLAVDLPADLPGLGRLLTRCDERVLEAGGRLYLAKDSRAAADTVHAMYPDLRAWRRVRERVDPKGVLVSDLARRLELL